MLHIILHQPEIPPNTGNVIRLAANTGASLHLIEPLGFALDDARLRRAGLDYHEYASVCSWPDLDACLAHLGQPRCFALSKFGQTSPYQTGFADGDALLFGCETRGLPDEVRAQFPPERLLRLPMRPGSRSLNLSNAVAVVVYEAWRQLEFAGSAVVNDF
ncbi:MAG: tRNA (cytidine(34)-2'-O)-methyltransferase [Xanthomonadales bacterium]|nr:tRNA (cytidine(34)-2'-O)-methyltransferase [Xanthomonadales bacterium]